MYLLVDDPEFSLKHSQPISAWNMRTPLFLNEMFIGIYYLDFSRGYYLNCEQRELVTSKTESNDIKCMFGSK